MAATPSSITDITSQQPRRPPRNKAPLGTEHASKTPQTDTVYDATILDESAAVQPVHKCRHGPPMPQRILCTKYGTIGGVGDGGDINNSTVIGYNTIIVELTGSVIFGSFVMVGRVERSFHMLWW